MSEAALPRIGIRLSSGLGPQRCVELAQAAEANGFASTWFAENPFESGVFVAAGACAAMTKRISLGIGVINPYTRHPVQIAMEFAALDQLSGGRSILGVGSGITGPIKRMGITNDRPVTAVREAIAIIRGLMTGNGTTFHGTVFNVDNARILRPPFPNPTRPGPAIYMAAAGERALSACGEIADGLIISNLTPPRTTERIVTIVAEAAAKADRPTPAVVQYVPCVARANGDAARQEVKSTIGEMLTSFWPVGDDWPPAREAIVAESGIPKRDFTAALERLRRGENAAPALDDRFAEAFAIAGTARECLTQAASYRAAGVDELALTIAGSRPLVDISYLSNILPAT
jgi:5,10-methylenetetrahydromethanopterin reductase